MTEQALALCALVFQWADAYAARFGEPPCFGRMSADIHAVIATLQDALETGELLGEASPAARKRDRGPAGSAWIPSPMTPLECLHQHGCARSSRNVWRYGDVRLGTMPRQPPVVYGYCWPRKTGRWC
jgi:hypothetical protein